MVAITKVLLFATSAAAIAVPRSAQNIQSSIATLDANVKTLTGTVNKYNGGLMAAYSIQKDESAVEKSIKSATSAASSNGNLNSADSKAIVDQVDSLMPDLENSLTALKNKKSEFASDGLQDTVHDDLVSLKSDTDTLAQTLMGVASSDQKGAAQGIVSKIDSNFNDAINAFA